MGRSIESDPLGLAGGSYSTYAYVDENPLGRADPLGLFTLDLNVNEDWTWHIPGGLDGNTSSTFGISCSCSRTCDGKWKLNQCHGNLNVTVTLLYGNPLGRMVARKKEQEHVNDYGAARSRIEAAMTRQGKPAEDEILPRRENMCGLFERCVAANC